MDEIHYTTHVSVHDDSFPFTPVLDRRIIAGLSKIHPRCCALRPSCAAPSDVRPLSRACQAWTYELRGIERALPAVSTCLEGEASLYAGYV